MTTASPFTDLAITFLTGEGQVYDPYTGADLSAGETPKLSHAARAGLEAPRYCPLCKRRMIVQVRPDGWSAKCSRHGTVDSALLER